MSISKLLVKNYQKIAVSGNIESLERLQKCAAQEPEAAVAGWKAMGGR